MLSLASDLNRGFVHNVQKILFYIVTTLFDLIMKYKESYFFCSQHLLSNVDEIHELYSCIDSVKWSPVFEIKQNDVQYEHRAAYKKAFDIEFVKYNWKLQAVPNDEEDLISEYKKDDIFVEIQFGNNQLIYRDYYRFYNSFTNRAISLAILIVPTNPKKFFPICPTDIQTIAEFDFAFKIFKLLPLTVPILLIGLLPEN